MKVFLVFLFFTSSLAKYEYGLQCRTLECLDKEELIESLKYYQSKENQALVEGKWLTYKKKTSLLRFFRPDNAPDDDDNPTCNICNSHPCNNGTCQVDPNSPWRFYKCTCPGDTKGDNCELPITCQPDTCGPGANCYVANHQTNCVCPFGFSGNPNDPAVGCSQQTLQACAAGDPHYTTFDQLSFDYMGTCPSIFSAPCTSLAGGYDNFQVVTHSDFYGDSRTISVASQIEVTMWGQKIHIDAKKGAFFNGIEITPPYNWPSKDASNITVLFTADMYTIQNNQYVTVTFTSNGQLCVKVPNVPEMKGLGTLCGLAGNIDGNPYNDIVYRNGTVYLLTAADLPSLKYPVIQPVNECFDSWITDDFTSTSDSTTCATAQQITNNSNCEVLPAIATCSVIQLASNGSGPFYMCQAMGAGVIQNYYDNCVFDVCQQDKLKCNVFTNFVKACQLALPNTDVLNWRDTLSCQWVCSRGSHYSSCTSSCPATCADQTRPDTCNQGCFEGCECDAGEVIDNTNLLATTCISLHDCGCTDPQGNLHGAGTPWLDQNCTVLAQCANGTYFPEDTECSEYGYCGTDSQHRMACKCLSGFTGDGFNCTDIDECQDSASCSVNKGYGTCTNTIGSYNCTCNPYHYGRNCEVYKPKRHCADLQLYWGVMDDGAYLIYPPYAFRDLPAYSGLEVYCDMTQFGGGWTLLSHDSGSGMADHTFVEYVNGFGSGVDRWLGLEITHQMTQTESTSLLLAKITRCGYDFWTDTVSDCTYPQFSVLNSTTTYAVVIPKKCTGTDKQYTGEFDGWARWELSQPGPAFQTFDQDTTIPKCSTVHKNVGFWYPVAQKDLCGPANLNGFRTSCNETAPDQKDLKPYDQYGGLLIADAWMYLRPQSYVPPPSPTTAPPPPPTTEIVPDTAPPAVNTVAPAPVTAAPAPVTAAPVPPI